MTLERVTPPRTPAPGWSDAYLRTPYVRGGVDPVTGWECWPCAGHMLAVEYGWTLPASIAELMALGLKAAELPAEERKVVRTRLFEAAAPEWRAVAAGPGVLVAFGPGGAKSDAVDHVGVMLDGRFFIHAETEDRGTRITSVRVDPYMRRCKGFYVPV